ncbi:hypothetical protein EVAR_46109_1 [Eumeta japonica]|uniref:Uncharacterized protein n=1 Tax=Eumeta variegata TaxID=151549 RepID=A0A4C1XGC0_EUMVA|nr:hypothetical protein EVAR_46109_1 [Eumeta japonica]
MRSRGKSCVFALINSRISGGNFRRSEDAGTSFALLDHCPDVVGKSTYGKVNLVCRRDVIGNAVEVWSVDFLKRDRHSFQLVILRMVIGLPPSGGPILI